LAKFQRLGPVWRKPSPKPWKQKKACTIWANERQYLDDQNIVFDFNSSAEVEISTEEGWVFVTEISTNSSFYAIERE
jgi:hypothetical protein